MAKTLAEFKRSLRVGDRVKVNNFGKNRTYVGFVTEIHTTYFKVAREVPKEYYDEYSPILRECSFFIKPDSLGDDHYYAVSIIEWQKARDSKVVGNTLYFLCYPKTLSNGQVLSYPYSSILAGHVWMKITIG